jgi:hypothetical protein
VIPGSSSVGNYCCQADSTGRGRRFYELKFARLKVVPKERAILPKSRILMLIAPAQDPPALAKVQQLLWVFDPAGLVGGSSRVEVTQPRENQGWQQHPTSMQLRSSLWRQTARLRIVLSLPQRLAVDQDFPLLRPGLTGSVIRRHTILQVVRGP